MTNPEFASVLTIVLSNSSEIFEFR